MRVEKSLGLFAAIVLALGQIGCGSAGDPRSNSSHSSEGEDQFEVGLVRVAVLEDTSRGAFTNVGIDALAAGRVEVEELGENKVEARVQGAAANVTYDVNFCSFAGGVGGCSGMAMLGTDGFGNGKVEFSFPQTGTFAGVFLLTRAVSGQIQNEFVTGFAEPSRNSNTIDSEEGGEAENEFEVNLLPTRMISGGLGSSFGAAGNDALVAGRVQVKSEVEVELTGAAVNALYALEFCRFGGVGPTGCVAVGSVTTDAEGNGKAELGFPMMGTFDGIFVLTRTVSGHTLNEFVAAFRIL